MALRCCHCDEIQMDNEESFELCSSETFIESKGRVYSRTMVASGLCPDCFGRMARVALEIDEAVSAA